MKSHGTTLRRIVNERITIGALLAASLLLAGCLQVRTTEHRIKLNADGSGEHALRLVDIRSDAIGDSAVTHDFNVMMSSFDKDVEAEFAAKGRNVLEKRLFVRGDTLIGELRYGFSEIAAAEGLRQRGDELFVVVPPEREILRTNGNVTEGPNNAKWIVWDRDETRLMYVIRERQFPPSVSLARRYRETRQ